MNIPPDSWGRGSTQRVMTLMWGGFTAAYVVFFYLFQDAEEIADSSLDGYLEVILLGVPTVVLLAGIMWLRESEVDDNLRPRMIGWTVAMGAFFVVAMYAALFVIESRFDTGEQWLILLMSLGFGASSGVAMGVLEIRSQQRERERKRSLCVARRKERERSQLEHLNHYLRHEVLNETQKINGFASLIADRGEVKGQHAEYLETIRHSSEEIARFVESIRTILDASDHEPDLESTDLRAIIDDEVRAIRGTGRSVEIEVHGEESAPVLGGDLLGRVFRNLLENAIEHNEGDVSIDVTVECGDEWVTVCVRDDGTGIPERKREELFEPSESGDHGYGLFLTKNLVQVYGGRLELGETGPGGTEFLVRLRPVERTDHSPVEAKAELAL